MSTRHFQLVRELFQQAVELDTAERSAFVRDAPVPSADVREEVLALLAQHAAHAPTGWDPGAVAEAVARLDNDPLVGGRVGSLRIEGVLASGGMGVVYRAWDTELDRAVAVKVLRNALPTQGALRRFEFESRILARLQHPGVARIYSTNTHELVAGRVPYIVMELVEGARTILEYALQRDLSIRDRLSLFAEVCDAIHHGHQKGIIHRDLKPANILVDRDGHPKVIDFGIARIVDPSDRPDTPAQSVTITGQVVGTLPYMSPEQCGATAEDGTPLDCDVRVDVYALGVVLHELLTGKLPLNVRDRGLFEAMDEVRMRTPAPLSSHDARLSGDVETIVHKCLAKDRRQRYGSASELAADIRRFLRHEPIAAGPPSARSQLGLFARRHRSMVATGALALLLLVTAIVVVSVALAKSRASQIETQREAANARRATEFLRNTLMSGIPGRAGPEGVDPITELFELAPRRWPHAAGQPGSLAGLRNVALLAASRLDQEFPDEPLLKADMAFDLSQLLASLDERQKAEPLAREAFHIRFQALGESHTDTINAAVGLAALATNPAEALEARQAAYRGSLRAYGPHDLRTATAGLDAGRALVGSGRREKGLALGRAAMDAARTDSDADLRARSRLEVVFAGWLIEVGENKQEIGRLLDAVRARAAQGGVSVQDHSEACYLASELLVTKFPTLARAAALQRESLELALSGLPPGDNWTREMRSAWARTLLRTGKTEPAVDEFRALSAELEDRGLRETDLAIKTRGRLAAALVAQQRNLDEARRLADEAADSLSKLEQGELNDRVIYFRIVGAAADAHQGSAREGLAAIDEQIKLVDRMDPAGNCHWVRCYASGERAECLIALGQFAEAESALNLAQKEVGALDDETSWFGADIQRTWVRLCEATGRPENAQEHRNRLPEVILSPGPARPEARDDNHPN